MIKIDDEMRLLWDRHKYIFVAIGKYYLSLLAFYFSAGLLVLGYNYLKLEYYKIDLDVAMKSIEAGTSSYNSDIDFSIESYKAALDVCVSLSILFACFVAFFSMPPKSLQQLATIFFCLGILEIPLLLSQDSHLSLLIFVGRVAFAVVLSHLGSHLLKKTS